MPISVFDLFSIGIGPSSSHTVGPMRAARRFLVDLEKEASLELVEKLSIDLYGSLALTGEGHCINKALFLGLEGEKPEEIDPDTIEPRLEKIRKKKNLHLFKKKNIAFDELSDLIFHKETFLPFHSNGMTFRVFDKEDNQLFIKSYYSVGGGFVVEEEESQDGTLLQGAEKEESLLPFPYHTCEELLNFCDKEQKSIVEIIWENERVWRSDREIREGLMRIWEVMKGSIERGCKNEGILPGGLNVERRAPLLFKKLSQSNEKLSDDPSQIMDWISLYALAVNEENAVGGQVVTAPTNGAAGVIPAVINYYLRFVEAAKEEDVVTFLLVAGAIGILYKKGASLSAAEVGCQGEVGVACSMAAAALVAVRGGTNKQIENGAEVGMEHNLGLTCDPIAGLVQIPCIERNTMGALKAVNAARLALAGEGKHKVSLDEVIATMHQTGKDMQTIYKETSQGGLAVNFVEC